MLYHKLAELYEKLSSIPSRLEKIENLSHFLKELKEEDKDVLYLLLGRIFPEYDQRETGISSQLAIKAIAKSIGTSTEIVVKEWKSVGDLGKVVEKLMKSRRQSTLHKTELHTQKVIDNLRKLPELEGKGTVDKKISLITELLTSASPVEALYLVRTLIGDLRIGIQESTIRNAMASAFFKDNEGSEKQIQDALDKTNDISQVFEIVKKGKIKDVNDLQMQVGKPIKVMLAQKARTIKEGFEKVGKPCAIEYKYDGFRLVIHKKGNEVKLFTRRLDDVTRQFPEVVDYVNKYVNGNSFILDSEAVGFSKKTRVYTPFQDISQRIKRKYDIEKLKDELPVEINVFDILYYNGKSLINEPFRKRTELVRKIIHDTPYKIIPSKQIITDDEKKAEEFFKKALKDRQEGVMMKSLDSVYQPGSRVGHMLKVKPIEKDLDLVIIGGEYGTGKRKGWLSSFILGCRKGNEFLEIGKMGTGIKEKTEEGVSFDELTKKLIPLITEEKGKTVKIKPKIVISVTYQEIQRSPSYKSGFALRFPRFTALRPDKPVSEISTLEEIEKDFEKQKRNWQYG